MKFFISFIMFVMLFAYSCDNEEKLTCETTGCKAGRHCDLEKKVCVISCTDELCAQIGQYCNPDTKECEYSCKESGCETGKVCDESINKCVAICDETSCGNDFHCDKSTGLCKENCIYNSCDDSKNEVCDPETRECIVKAENFCTETSCTNGAHCNTTTGHCVGGCSELQCSEGKVCDPATVTCVDKCSFYSCDDQRYCNIQTGVCEPLLEYPESPYANKFTGNSNDSSETDTYESEIIGKVLENITWTAPDNKIISLQKYYSLASKVDYLMLLILNETMGDCENCELEGDALGDFYRDNIIENGFPRYAIVNSIIDDDTFDGNMPDPDGYASAWKEKYHQDFPSIGDLDRKLTPYNDRGKVTFKLILNAKTMEILGFEYGSSAQITNLKAKIREIEKNYLCDELKCEQQASYCIYKDSDHTAHCN